MRIISGKYGGRILKPPKNFRARPTTDLAREGLFNILNNYFEFEGLKVLDLFAGTGSVGIEFLSRGAGHVDFIEKNYIHSNFIKKALNNLEINNAKVIRTDFFKIISGIKSTYDIIFADPPYDLKSFDKIPELIQNENIINSKGLFILEHSDNYSFTSNPFFMNHRKYGSVNFSFFQSPE
ncbi:MAG: 16S rRNA (guanine(966)-N(2))-methyltransferase RsmD [Bacteroidales bacterium]